MPYHTKIFHCRGTDLDIEQMSNGNTVLWQQDKQIGLFGPNSFEQHALVKRIQELYPTWQPGEVERIQ